MNPELQGPVEQQSAVLGCGPFPSSKLIQTYPGLLAVRVCCSPVVNPIQIHWGMQRDVYIFFVIVYIDLFYPILYQIYQVGEPFLFFWGRLGNPIETHTHKLYIYTQKLDILKKTQHLQNVFPHQSLNAEAISETDDPTFPIHCLDLAIPQSQRAGGSYRRRIGSQNPSLGAVSI